jgi:hypothetical protein
MFRTIIIGAAALGAASAFSLPAFAQECEGAASIGSAGSAATAEGKAKSRTNTNINKNNLQSQSKAQAMDKGTFSKSKTKTKIRHGEVLDSRTKTMAHVPGEKPVMDTTRVQTEVE